MNFRRSRELFERSKMSLAGGVSSGARMSEKPVPLFFERGKGSRLYDVDGNELIDYALAFGPDIFGHSPDFILQAVASGMGRSFTLGGLNEIDIRVSEMIQQVVPCAELIRYASSGTEIDQAALRLARAYTGRNKFIKFEGHYHGWADNVHYSVRPGLDEAGPADAPIPVPTSAGIPPSTADEIIVLPWNDINVLRTTLEHQGHDIAAIITEPINCNTGHIFPKRGYLEEMRQLCDDIGVVLIFDEVITGFRVALGGAQELLGVIPDLATFAKAAGGGFPLSLVAGKKEIMAQLEEGTVNHLGTLNANIVSMSAAEAAIGKFIEGDGAVYKQLYATGNLLIDGLRELARKHELALLIQGLGPTFSLLFTDASEITDYRTYIRRVDQQKCDRFRQGMLERGIRLAPNGWCLVSTAHSEDDVAITLSAADEVMASL